MRTFKFTRENNKWYIDLPGFLARGGDKADLEMVMGADVMLERYAQGRPTVDLYMDTAPFPDADALILKEVCAPLDGGGAWYDMRWFRGLEVNQTIWLCDVTVFVFGEMPEKIFCKEV